MPILQRIYAASGIDYFLSRFLQHFMLTTLNKLSRVISMFKRYEQMFKNKKTRPVKSINKPQL